MLSRVVWKMRIAVSLSAVAGIAIAGAGCGGGAGSYNVDDGFYTDGRGNKTITRTLDNRSDMDVDVTLEINGVDYLDTIRIRRDDYVNVTIERMRVEDWVWFRGRFENGDSTEGTFAEDGTTVFTNSRSGAGGMTTTSVDGKSAVKAGGKSIKLDASSRSGKR
jgi:hypothetical protein